MPLYEYECFVCRHRFERIQRVADDPLKTCPECGGSVRRLLGVPALQFKGSGFYITDYVKKASDDGASSKDSKAKPSGAPAEKDTKTTTDSKDADTPKTSSSKSKAASSDD
jgi:putative FmdB family regulatory protein